MSITQTHIMYVAIILSSTACIWLSERVQGGEISIIGVRKSHKLSLFRVLFTISALLILIIPLVKRTCGADTNVYYYDYLHDRIYNFDTLFSYLLAFLHRYISEPQVGLGVISTLTIIISVFSLLRVKKDLNITLAFFAYATCIYFYSYNYMRNVFALAFVFVGYSLCMLEKRRVAIIPFAIAALFHLSAIIVLAIHIALMNFRKHRTIVIMFGILGLVVFLAMPYRILSIISVERYSSQIVLGGSSTQIGIGTIIRAIPILYLLYIYHKKYNSDNRYTWLLVFAIANVIFSFLGYYVGTASRISNIILVFHIIYAVPMFVKEDDNVGRAKNSKLIFVLYCLVMYYFLSHNFEAMMIVPYY